MTEKTFRKNAVVEALKINVGIALSEPTKDCYLSGHKIEEDYLVVYLDINVNVVFLINLDSTPRFPIRVSYYELYAAIDGGELDVIGIDWPQTALTPLEDLPDGKKSKALDRFTVIKPLLNDLEATLMNGYGQGCFKKVIKESGRSKQYIYDCFLGFLYYGQRPSGLALPIGKNIFHIPKEKREIRVKQGRPNQDLAKGKVLDDYDYACFEKAKRLYQKRNGPTLIRVHELMLKKHYFASRTKLSKSEHVKSIEKYRVNLKPPTERPTFGQFYNWLRNKYGGLTAVRDKSRMTPVEFSKDLAGRKGNAYATIIAFGQQFVLDETPFDEELVSIFDPKRRTKIGKATLYFVIDQFSKYIVGVYITTENPSFKTVRQAIFISATDKTEFISQYGLDPKSIDWSHFGVPNTLFVDNAEFRNKRSEGAVCDLQLILQFARRGRGDDKPDVEQLFRVFASFFKGLSKAHQTKSLADIHNQIARKHASLTQYELYVIAIVYINYHNNFKRIREYPFDKTMRQDGVEPIPVKIVEWSLKYRPGYTVHYEPNELYLKLLTKGQVSVGQKGIYFPEAGLWYNCEWTLANGYQDRKVSRNKVESFDCRFNDNFLDVILIDTPTDGLQVATLDNRSALYSGLSLHEIKLEQDRIKKEEASAQQIELEYRLGFLDFLNSVVVNSQQERESAPVPNISKIKDNRKLEALTNQLSDANKYLQSLKNSSLINFSDTEDSTFESDEEHKAESSFYNEDEESDS